ncbi:Synaptojanin-2 [Linnemannia schmuckeri]|uniref:Synaptojanin-2 n=1 Tax=Linnemannia schmuckeri TaxID=64567 RepID=A0A9P5V856_9FUNG|nr:Synaptojanin-2 [Linnemannia schmuckeri]
MVFLNDKDNHVEGLLFEHQERLSTTAPSPAATLLEATVGNGGAYESLEDLQTEDDVYQVDSDSRPLLGGGGGKKASGKHNTKGHRHHHHHHRHSHSSRRHSHSHSDKDGKKAMVWEESIFSCDYIFWTGDLNYRLDLAQSDGSLSSHKKKNKQKSQSTEDLLSQSTMPDLTASEIVHAIKAGQLRQLYSHDQLSAQRKTLNVFKGFHEAPLAFGPTYKCKMGSATEYDISKRVPAWTDRVLWFVHPKNATSADEDHEDELDAWDEHSREMGHGTLPLDSSPSTRIRSGNYSSMASSLSSWSGSKSRGTFSSLSKRGSGPARGPMTAGLFQSPLGISDNSRQQPLTTARSNQTLTSLSSRNSSSHLQQAAANLSQSPTTSSPLGEPCTSPLQIHYYTSHPHYASSDHKPVSALFTLLPHNLAWSHHEPNPYGIDPKWKSKKWFGKKLTTVVGHMLRWGFLALGLGAIVYFSVLIRRHLHGW